MDLRNQALHVLTVYLDRSARVLARLERQDVDGVLQMLRLKTVAFHNWQYADTQLQSRGVDLSKDREFLELWQRITVLDETLRKELLTFREQLQEDMLRSRQARVGISKYRSGRLLRSAIEQGI